MIQNEVGKNVFRLHTASGSEYDFRVEHSRHASVWLTTTRVVNTTDLRFWQSDHHKWLAFRDASDDEFVVFTARCGLKALGLTYRDIFELTCREDANIVDGMHPIAQEIKDVIMEHAATMDKIFYWQAMKRRPQY